MEMFSFIFTIFFMLLGPAKLIPLFAGLTRGADARFKRDTAVRAAVIASVLCVFVALAGGALVSRYRISIDALRIAGGLVLLISGLQVIFQKAPHARPPSGTPNAMQLAVSPLAAPGIVPPAGVAAILICAMLAPGHPGMWQVIAACLGLMMVLDFLVMYFIDRVVKMSALMVVLAMLGSVLAFVQVGLAVEILLNALEGRGLVLP